MAHFSAPSAPGSATGGPTLFEPGRNCMAVASAPRGALLIDSAAYTSAFVQAAQRAQHSIIIVGWEFDSRAALQPVPPVLDSTARLGEFLNRLVRRRRGLRVYVLAWDFALALAERPDLQPLYTVDWRPHRRIQLHYDSSHPPGASHHQKIVVIDDALAFCGARDVGMRRGRAHPHASHAVTMLDGEAAAVLAQVAHRRWLLATGEMLRPVEAPGDPWPPALDPDLRDAAVAVSRTLARSEATEPVREIETLYLDLIRAARRRIYLETPYFTSERIAAALAARLAGPSAPEIALVTRDATGGWLDAPTIRALRDRRIAALRRADPGGCFEAYCPVVEPGLTDACGDCQSSVMIVDDDWLHIGSAALTNRSLALDSECDVTYEGCARPHIRSAIRDFRDRLLALHLDVTPARVREADAASGSLRAAIHALGGRGRRLKPLAEQPALLNVPAAAIAADEPEPPVGPDGLIDQFAPQAHLPATGPAWGRIAAIALVFAGLAALWRYTPLSNVVAPERAIEWARTVGAVGWAPLAVMLAYTPAAFLMFPRPLLTLFAVIAFGSWLGFVYALTGISLAALAAYYAGRALPRDTIRSLAGERLNEMTEVLRRRGLLAVFAVRIVPVGPFAVVSMVAGAVRIRLSHYVVGTLLGIVPGTLMTTIFVDQLTTALEDPARINYGLVALIVLFFTVLILLVRRWFSRQQAAHERQLTQSS